MSGLRDYLLSLGWVDKGDILVRFSHPRIGWKPADGTLIVGYHEHPAKVNSLDELNKILYKEKTKNIINQLTI